MQIIHMKMIITRQKRKSSVDTLMNFFPKGKNVLRIMIIDNLEITQKSVNVIFQDKEKN